MTDRIRFSSEIQNRYQFGALCQRLGLRGTAVELGVHRAVFSGHFLGGWDGRQYFAVDHYLPYSDIVRSRYIDRLVAHSTLARFADRVQWRELDAVHGLEEHAAGSLDFVYIDAGHTYWTVYQELAAAWPRIKPGGILAGHDFHCQTPDVVRAVKEFSEREGVTIWLTMDDWEPWSWFCYRPEGTK